MISLTSLTVIQDFTLPANEVHLHPDVFDAVWAAFLRADIHLSLQRPTLAVVHQFTPVGDNT